MIRTDQEYAAALKQLSKVNELLEAQRKKFQEEGFNAVQIEKLIAPSLTYAKQSREEVAFYEQLRQGEIPPISSFSSSGQLLVALRIAKGISQRELAHRLGVSEAIVSRDEKNEYSGVTMEKAQRIVDAVGGRVEISLSITDGQAISITQNSAVKKTTRTKSSGNMPEPASA